MLNRCFLIFIVIIVKIQNLTGRNIVNISVFLTDTVQISTKYERKKLAGICKTYELTLHSFFILNPVPVSA